MSADSFLRRVGLRPRVTVVAALTVGVALAVGAVLLVGLLRSRLETAATTAVTLRARDVAALAHTGALPRVLALPGEESAFVQVVDEVGTVIASTRNIEGESAVSMVRPSGNDLQILTLIVTPLDQADAMRVAALNATVLDGAVTVYAGESLKGAADTTAAIVRVLGFGLPVLVLLVAGVTWWSVGRTLQPVRRITRTMADITANDLHRRVPVPAACDEIGRLALTVNETLGRLDSSVEQQRRFVADAGHELRGPLAALRADLEISVTHPERTSWQQVARDTLSDVERLQHLTEDLLLLAQGDSQRQRPHQSVDLAAIVTEAARTMRRDNIRFDLVGVNERAMVNGNPEQLRRMVRNLMDNAEKHADHDVTVTLTTGQAMVRLQIADDGPGIPSASRGDIFERFVRLDSARTRDISGTGLGLAIVDEVVARHHGSITVTDSDPRGASFTIELPST